MNAYLTRTLENTIERAMRTFPAILVTGPRQSGKTTLLRECFSRTHRFVSLEHPDIRALAREDPNGFFRENPPPVILDEIQYTPELLHYVKSRIDTDRRPGRWLLSGSQNFSLMAGISQSLSGRVAVLSLLPLSLGEALQSSGIGRGLGTHLKSLFGDKAATGQDRPVDHVAAWMLRGGYPEIRHHHKVDRRLWCASYVQTYLERDVRQILNVGDLNLFSRFLRMIAARTGQVLNMSALARDIGISVTTVKKWLSVLESSYQVFLLPPYFNNLGKRIVKSPKLYFLDTAVATSLMGLHDPEALRNGPSFGPLFETLVVSEWVKAFLHRGERPELYYFRSQSGLEVDLLIDRNGRLYPMEIKASATLMPGHAKGLKRWRRLAGDPAMDGLIIADTDADAVMGRIRGVSWQKALMF